MKIVGLFAVAVIVGLLSGRAASAQGVGVVLRATGKWYVEKDAAPIHSGQELQAQSIVYSKAEDGAGSILIKVYSHTRPEPYTAPAKIALPAQQPVEPGVFEQFLQLYHRLVDPPRVDLKTTLAEAQPARGSGQDLFVGVDPATQRASGELYLIKKYKPFDGTLGYSDSKEIVSPLNGGSAVLLMNKQDQFRLQPQKGTASSTASGAKSWTSQVEALVTGLEAASTGPDVILPLKDDQVDLLPAFGGMAPAGAVSIHPLSVGKDGAEGKVNMVLSWPKRADNPTMAYSVPLSAGLYRLSNFDVNLQREFGYDSMILVVGAATKAAADAEYKEFDAHLSTWGELVDADTRRSLSHAFFRYMAEKGVR